MATEATANSGDNNQKPTYTPEQQEHINSLIKEAMGRAGSEARAEAATKATEATRLQNELDAAKAELTKAKTSTDKKEAKADVDALQAQLAEVKQAQSTIQQEVDRWKATAQDKEREVQMAKAEALGIRKQVAITKAADPNNFVSIEAAMKLTENQVKYDEAKGKFVVLNEQGVERLNASLEPMSLNEFYAEYAAKNPWLVRGDVRPGAGSTPGTRGDLSANGKFEVAQIFGKNSDSKLASQLMKENPNEYKRLKGIARSAGLIA